MKKEPKIIYYDNPLTDEFSSARITPKVIDESYRYIRKGVFKRFTHFFWYRIVAFPTAKIYLWIKFRHRIVNREVLKNEKDGYFIYGNHTQPTADAFIPTFVAFPGTVYVIVHPNNVSMPFLGRITPSLGALPLPSNTKASVNFMKAIKTRAAEGRVICIYPEAHIWPYYTGIREFSDASFTYPVMLKKPVYCFTNTYRKSKNGRRTEMVTYVDGPFTADASLPAAAQRAAIREQVYKKMVERSKNSNVEVIKYISRGQ